jgi:hypothetical protein
LIWLRLWIGVGRLWIRYWTSGFHKIRGISWLAEDLLGSQERLCSMELVMCEGSHNQQISPNTKHDIINIKPETRVYVIGKENQTVNSQSLHSSESCMDQMSTGL